MIKTISLIDMLAMKRDAEGAEQKPGFLVVGRSGADHDADAGNHSGWISSCLSAWGSNLAAGGKVEMGNKRRGSGEEVRKLTCRS